MEKICGIYCIENLTNGKRYIGQSVDIERRRARHLRELNSKEINYIKSMFSNYVDGGYNISWGGNAPMAGVEITDEHRRKLSIANSGKNNAMYGKKTPKSVLDKISKVLTGRVQTEIQKFNNPLGQIGKKVNNKKSKYIGVTEHVDGGFVARIKNTYTKERLYLGYFKSKKKAAEAYDKESWKIYRDPSKLNFPKSHGDNKNGS